ncbi:MAG: DUF5711 family protein [Oscillospiraceae bacterium]|nr:DUF5711 family protein [Oscillospiraceae bacterium]
MEDINKFRKKLRRQSRIKSLLVLLLIAALALAAYFAFDYLQKSSSASNGADGAAAGFPLSFSGEEIIKLESAKNFLVVLTDKQLAFYTSKGRREQTRQHGGDAPMIKANGSYVVLYESRGNALNVYFGASEQPQFSFETANQISLCEITPDGYLAVVTSHEKYESVLTVYRPDGSEAYKWNSAKEQILSLSLSKGGNKVAMLTLASLDGVIQTNVTDYDLKNNKENFRMSLDGAAGISITQKAFGGYHIVCQDRIVSLAPNGDVLYENRFDGMPRFFCNRESDNTAVILGRGHKSDLLMLYGEKEENIGRYQSEGSILGTTVQESGVVVMYEDKTVILNKRLKEIKNAESRKEKGVAVCFGNNLYQVSNLGIEKIPIK